MTAKEKAKQLVELYDETLTYLESKSKANQCALIAVDEILTELTYIPYSMEYFIKMDYWREVKQEIINL